MELKHPFPDHALLFAGPFNRTLVELKQVAHSRGNLHVLAFNRTLVELKQPVPI